MDVISGLFSSFNKHPSLTVKNLRLQLVKMDHVILVYLSLTGKTVRLWTLTFVSWFNHSRVFNKFKPLNIWIKMIFIAQAFIPSKVVIYQSIHSSDLIWRAFWRTYSNFPAFWISLKFGFFRSRLQHFWSVFLFSL